MSDYLSFHLPDEFLNEYTGVRPEWGFDIGGENSLSELTFLSKYSRLKEDGSKEQWQDVCQRCVEGMYSILKDWCKHNRTPWNEFKAQRAAQDAYDRMFHFKWTPPGRGLWSMGTPFVHENQSNSSLNNCFGGETQVITAEHGITTLIEILGEDVTIYTKDGWKVATVRQFGKQPLNTLTLRAAEAASGDAIRHTVRATGNHRWLLKSEEWTEQLQVGDTVEGAVVRFQYREGAIAGKSIGLHLGLRGRKQVPVDTEGVDYIGGFIEGAVQAEATITDIGEFQLSCDDEETARWLIKHAAVAGYSVTGFDRQSGVVTMTRGGVHWVVESIEEGDVPEPVYCATVPGVGAFTLASGIYTGNCSFVSTDKLSTHSAYEATMPFSRLIEQSMCGVGVGFDTKGAGKLTIWEPLGDNPVTFVIPDNREGWSQSVSTLLESYFFKNRQTVVFDYSQIRPAGAPLKAFGGTASGPGPLRWLHESIAKQFAGRHGEKITSRDIVDLMNKMGKVVVAGGARRSALISLGESSDEDYINLKNWDLPENAERTGPDGWAWSSNNSVLVNREDDLGHLVDKIAINGEPGIIWLDMMREYGRLIDPPTNADYRVKGSNPCLVGYSRLLTKEYGLAQIGDLSKLDGFTVYNGDGEWVPSFAWETGVKKVFRVKLANGQSIDVTGNHILEVRKVFGEKNRQHEYVEMEAKDVQGELITPFLADGSWVGVDSVFPEEALFFGLIQGDGCFDRRNGTDVSGVSFYNYEPEFVEFIGKFCANKGWPISKHAKGSLHIAEPALVQSLIDFGFSFETLPYRTLPSEIFKQNPLIVKKFLKGLYSANGAAQPKYNRISLKGTCREMFGEVQQLLLALGFNAYITTNAPAEITWANGVYESRESYDLNVGSRWGYDKFQAEIGFLHDYKSVESEKEGYAPSVKSSEVVGVEYIGEFPVFDFNEAETHWGWANGFKVHNCAEISLESSEFCTLSETYPSRHESFEDFKKSIKHAYLYAKAVTLMPSTWAETNEVITRNRRIGVSMTGIVEFIEKNSWNEIQHWMDEGYGYLNAIDTKYSEWLGVRNSIKITTVKPAGTTSLIAGTTAGVHWPTTSGWYIRRLRFHKTDPMVQLIRDAGYPVETDQNDPGSTVVASFPVKGLDVRSEREVSIWEKAHLAAMAQRYWADNMVSVTVSFREEEQKEILPLLRSLKGQLKSISFLPITDEGTTYAQAPYEPISEEDALQMLEKVKHFDMQSLYSNGKEAEGEMFCTTDVCEIRK